RGAANVAVLLLAGGACVAAFAALTPLVPLPIALGLAIVAYTATTHGLVSSVFSLREGIPVLTVFRERFLVPTLLHVALGVAGGLATWALWSLHPLAVLALVPFAYLALAHVRLAARTEREALVHKRLDETTRALVGERDIERVAARVLETCGDFFQAGRTTLRVGERSWKRDFEGGASEASMEAPLVGPG